jgi:hypothetical protein
LRIVVELFIKYAKCVIKRKENEEEKIYGWGWDFMFL